MAQVNPLISFQTLNIPVMSWNTEKRLGFSWVINGVRTSDGQAVYAPAITALFMNRDVSERDKKNCFSSAAGCAGRILRPSCMC